MTERCKFEVSTGFAKFNYEVSTEIYRVLIIGVECMLSERSVLYDSSSSTRKNRFYFLQKKFTVHDASS